VPSSSGHVVCSHRQKREHSVSIASRKFDPATVPAGAPHDGGTPWTEKVRYDKPIAPRRESGTLLVLAQLKTCRFVFQDKTYTLGGLGWRVKVTWSPVDPPGCGRFRLGAKGRASMLLKWLVTLSWMLLGPACAATSKHRFASAALLGRRSACWIVILLRRSRQPRNRVVRSRLD
jgi:hypothetical protein